MATHTLPQGRVSESAGTQTVAQSDEGEVASCGMQGVSRCPVDASCARETMSNTAMIESQNETQCKARAVLSGAQGSAMHLRAMRNAHHRLVNKLRDVGLVTSSLVTSLACSQRVNIEVLIYY